MELKNKANIIKFGCLATSILATILLLGITRFMMDASVWWKWYMMAFAIGFIVIQLVVTFGCKEPKVQTHVSALFGVLLSVGFAYYLRTRRVFVLMESYRDYNVCIHLSSNAKGEVKTENNVFVVIIGESDLFAPKINSKEFEGVLSKKVKKENVETDVMTGMNGIFIPVNMKTPSEAKEFLKVLKAFRFSATMVRGLILILSEELYQEASKEKLGIDQDKFSKMIRVK